MRFLGYWTLVSLTLGAILIMTPGREWANAHPAKRVGTDDPGLWW